MRNAIGTLALLSGLALMAGQPLQAQSTTRDGGSAATIVSVVVPAFVKVVTVPADPASGLPFVARVITNDPALRASTASGLRPEVTTPEAIATFGAERRAGGAEGRGGAELAGEVTIRYTIATP